MLKRGLRCSFQSLEKRRQKFPIIGKQETRVSNRWKKQGPVFQSLEKNGVMSFQSLEKFPIIGKTVFCLLAASAFALSAPAMTYYMDPTGSGDGASWDEAEPVS